MGKRSESPRQKTTISLSERAKGLLTAVCDKRGQNQSVAIERMIIKAAKEEGIIPDEEGKK